MRTMIKGDGLVLWKVMRMEVSSSSLTGSLIWMFLEGSSSWLLFDSWISSSEVVVVLINTSWSECFCWKSVLTVLKSFLSLNRDIASDQRVEDDEFDEVVIEFVDVDFDKAFSCFFRVTVFNSCGSIMSAIGL